MSASTPDQETIGRLLCAGAATLRDVGIPDPRREARLLLSHASGLTIPDLLLKTDQAVQAGGFLALIARRAAREPMAHITGRQGFWTLDFHVSPATLIPRADSEALIEAVLACRPDRGALRHVLDLGTGTGCLLLAVLAEYPAAFGIGVDLVPAAAALAAGNAQANGLAGRAAFLAGHWAGALQGRFDLVIANPPYIPQADLAGLMPDVGRYEPGSALDGGPDGLVAYRAILGQLPALLAPGGLAVLELGIGQAQPVAALARQAGWQVECRADLAGIPRAMILQAAQQAGD